MRRQQPARLFIIADGPRQDHADDLALCRQARQIIDQIDWECEVVCDISETNLGCENRVISGLDLVFSQSQEAIILEDDCLPEASFFTFCAEMLARFREEPRIMSISGSNFQFGRRSTEKSYYYSQYPHTWGWATWQRAWRLNDEKLIKDWPQLRDSNWLESIVKSPISVKLWRERFQRLYQYGLTWDYRWFYSCWRHNSLAVTPVENLISNIGFGSNANSTRDVKTETANLPVKPLLWPLDHPTEIIRNQAADDFTERAVFSAQAERVIAIIAAKRALIQACRQLNIIFTGQEAELLTVIDSVADCNAFRGLNYLRAVCLIKNSQLNEARKALLKELLDYPDNDVAEVMLRHLFPDGLTV